MFVGARRMDNDGSQDRAKHQWRSGCMPATLVGNMIDSVSGQVGILSSNNFAHGSRPDAATDSSPPADNLSLDSLPPYRSRSRRDRRRNSFVFAAHSAARGFDRLAGSAPR